MRHTGSFGAWYKRTGEQIEFENEDPLTARCSWRSSASRVSPRHVKSRFGERWRGGGLGPPFARADPQDEGNSCDLIEFQGFFFGERIIRNRPPQIRFVLSEPFWGYGGPLSGQFLLLGEIPRAVSGKPGSEVGLSTKRQGRMAGLEGPALRRASGRQAATLGAWKRGRILKQLRGAQQPELGYSSFVTPWKASELEGLKHEMDFLRVKLGTMMSNPDVTISQIAAAVGVITRGASVEHRISGVENDQPPGRKGRRGPQVHRRRHGGER